MSAAQHVAGADPATAARYYEAVLAGPLSSRPLGVRLAQEPKEGTVVAGRLQRADLDRIGQAARDTLARCRNCAQTSFSVLMEEFELDGHAILRALTPFPGIALRGETCGAVVGSLMALGLVYGRDDLEDWHAYIGSLPPARRFVRRFDELHGSTACEAILEAKLGRKFNLADTGQSLEYVEAGGPQVCGEILAGALQVAAEIIAKKAPPARHLQP